MSSLRQGVLAQSCVIISVLEPETLAQLCVVSQSSSLHMIEIFNYRFSSYNKSQRDALFLKFILIKNSTRFKQIYCTSSGVSTLYSQQLVFVMLVMLTVCQQGHQQTVDVTGMTNISCCEYSIKTPDDGQQICPKHVEFFTKMKLRNSASCWLLL